MTFEDWNLIYASNIRWALRRCEDSCLECYKDKKEDWFRALEILSLLESELFKKHYNNDKKTFKIRYREWFALCHKYIHRARKENNYTVGDFIFHIWNDGRHYFTRYKDPWNAYDLCRKITKEEVEFANKYLIPELETEAQKEAHKKTIWYDENSRVLIYRNNKFIIDNCWGVAHTLYKGKERSFSLDWDWWYPIDTFIDLEKGWK